MISKKKKKPCTKHNDIEMKEIGINNLEDNNNNNFESHSFVENIDY